MPYFSIDNVRVTYTKKRSKFVKNEHARYTLERYERSTHKNQGTVLPSSMKKGKNLERLITATRLGAHYLSKNMVHCKAIQSSVAQKKHTVSKSISKFHLSTALKFLFGEVSCNKSVCM
jgi:hypothetical protein